MLLLTRPRPQSELFLAACEARVGHPVRNVIAPIIKIDPVLPSPGLDGYVAVVFTSANAVRQVANGQGLIAFCVGEQTAQAATAAGFDAVSADGDASALIGLILAKPPQGRLLHLRGEQSRGDVAERLTAGGAMTDEAIVYRQVQQHMPADAIDQVRAAAHVIAPVFSPLSAELVSSALARAGVTAEVLAISETAAKAWAGPARSVQVAAKPDMPAMVELVAERIGSDSAC